MNFDSIEGLTQEQILEAFDDVYENIAGKYVHCECGYRSSCVGNYVSNGRCSRAIEIDACSTITRTFMYNSGKVVNMPADRVGCACSTLCQLSGYTYGW